MRARKPGVKRRAYYRCAESPVNGAEEIMHSA